jgi:hypothetical protein
VKKDDGEAVPTAEPQRALNEGRTMADELLYDMALVEKDMLCKLENWLYK